MKKALPLIAFLLLPLLGHAQGEKKLFALVNYNNTRRTPMAIQLPQVNSAERGPVIDLTQKTFVVPRGRLFLSLISGFSFETRVVDGVAEVSADKPKEAAVNVYSIDGRLVRRAATTLDGLQPGIYIAGGKKYIVK